MGPRLINFLLFAIAFVPSCGYLQGQLSVTYGASGIQSLSYDAKPLEDLAASPSDAFHIWHMKLTDMTGNLLSGSSYGWGETNIGKSWNTATKSWTYLFVWGSVTVQFAQSGDTLNMMVTESNNANSNVILDGASIYPFVLHFPQLPAGFTNQGYPQLAFNTTGPSVTLANFGASEVAAIVPNANKPLYSGFLPAGGSNCYTAFISSTTPDGLATFQPQNDRPVQPGQTDSFTVSLRFAPSGTPTSAFASDAYSSWAQNWPPQLSWTDRRSIGTAYLATSPLSGNINQSGGYPNNPRRFFNDSNADDFDINTPSGMAALQARVLQQAVTNVQNMQRLGAQGSITWDIEGEQFPQSTSYVCEPDNIAQIAPEMETAITDPNSPYVGMKLDDAYFKVMTNAGFRVGVCVRPQHFTLNADGTAQQTTLPDSLIGAELTRKIQFAHNRWGATLFYIDSTVDLNGAALDAAIFQQVAAGFPDSLLIPEEFTPKYYAYTAPFMSYIFHESLGTDAGIHFYYPSAFSAILVNDADASALSKDSAALTASVKAGDILMTHVDYWQANNPVIVSIYAAAGSTSSPAPSVPPFVMPVAPPALPPPSSPAPSTPQSTPLVSILSPSGDAAISGAIVVQGSISTGLDAAGSYLMVDGSEIGAGRVAAAPFNYPLDTSTLSQGQHQLQLWAHDLNNEVLLSAPVSVTITPSTGISSSPGPIAPLPRSGMAILYPTSGQTILGVIQVSVSIASPLDAAGSYLMVDGIEFGTQRLTSGPYIYSLDTTALAIGQHALQVWAHDTNNETLLSSVITVNIAR